MGFGSPPSPSIRMPPPSAHPPTLASIGNTTSTNRAAKEAEGQGFDDTIGTSPQGITGKASTAPATLLGQ